MFSAEVAFDLLHRKALPRRECGCGSDEFGDVSQQRFTLPPALTIGAWLALPERATALRLRPHILA